MNLPSDLAARIVTLDFAGLNTFLAWRLTTLRERLETALPETETASMRGEIKCLRGMLNLDKDVRESLENPQKEA